MGCASSAAVAAPAPVACKTLDVALAKHQLAANSKTPAGRSLLDYELLHKLGKGSYAQVHLAKCKKTKAEVAVKIRYLHPESSSKSRDKDKVLKSCFNEVSLWKAIGTHENCVELIDCFFDEHLAYMVMEKCTGTLFQYLKEHKRITEGVFGTAFQQILTGLEHMHSLGLVHRDIKPDNFLVGGKQGSIAKLCDFGLSADLPESGILNGCCGTAPYMPPEMLSTNSYDQKADVWSVGAVAYLLLCGAFPYQTPDGSSTGMKMSILNGSPADCKRRWLSDQATHFLQMLLIRNPEERPTAQLALDLPFLTIPDTTFAPCLHQALDMARTTGAFDSQDIKSRTDVDRTLHKLTHGLLGDIKITSFTSSNATAVMSKGSAAKLAAPGESGLGDSGTASVVTTSTRCGSSRSSSEESSRASTNQITTRRYGVESMAASKSFL